MGNFNGLNGSSGQGIGSGLFLAGSVNYSVSTGNTVTISDTIGGGTNSQITGGFTKSGGGMVVLSGVNSFTGGVTLSAGELSVGADTNLGDPGNTLTFNGGTLQVTGTTFTSTPRTISWGSGGGGFDVVSGSAFTVSQSLSNGGGLTKLGAGTLTLSGAADNVGLGVTVTAGTLILAKTSTSGVHAIGGGGLDIEGGTVQLGGMGGDQIYDGASVTVNSGTFDLNGLNETISALSGTNGSIVNNGGGAGTLTMTSGSNTSFTGTAGNSGGGVILVQQGSGTLTLGGTTDNNSLSVIVDSGTVILDKTSTSGVHAIGTGLDIEGGKVQLVGSAGGGGDEIYDGAAVTVNSGVFDLHGQSETIGTLTGTGGTITNTGSTLSTLTVGGFVPGAGTYRGMLTDGAGGLALVMAGSGTLVLTGQNTFTKGTIASSSVVSVSIGGKLSGSGSVSAINGAGTVAPGGAQILTGTQVDPSAGMSFDFSFAQTGVPNYANASASGNDVLHLTNSTPFTFALTSANTVTLDFTGDSLQLGQIYYGGFFTTAGVPSSTFSNANFVYTGTFGPIVQYEGMVPVSGANFATGTASGEVMEFEVVAIPEPSSIGMALAGLGFLAVGATLSAAGLSLGTASFAESFPANSYRRLA